MIQTMIEPIEPLEPYMTIAQLADRYKVTARAVLKWINKGHFPNAYRVSPEENSPYRIPVSDVIEYEKKRRVKH